VEAKEAVQPVLDWAVALNYRKRVAQIYTILGAHAYAWEEDFEQSFEFSGKAMHIAKELSDANSLYWVNYWLAVALAHDCQFQETERHFTNCMEIAKARSNSWAVRQINYNTSSWLYYRQGRSELSYESAVYEQDMRPTSDTYSEILHPNLACFARGLLTEATEYNLRTINACERVHHLYGNVLAHENLGQIYFELKEYEESEQWYKRTAQLLESGRLLPSWRNLNELGAAKAAARASDRAVDLDRLKGYDASNKVKLYSGAFKRYLAELLLSYSDRRADEAEHWITRAIDTDRTNGMMLGVAHDYVVYAEWFQLNGDLSRARENLGKAIEVFTECGADGWVKRTEEMLEKL
jgi:tetratricopeptide (TPR) repeat protein